MYQDGNRLRGGCAVSRDSLAFNLPCLCSLGCLQRSLISPYLIESLHGLVSRCFLLAGDSSDRWRVGLQYIVTEEYFDRRESAVYTPDRSTYAQKLSNPNCSFNSPILPVGRSCFVSIIGRFGNELIALSRCSLWSHHP
jgi:hypothetical protein